MLKWATNLAGSLTCSKGQSLVYIPSPINPVHNLLYYLFKVYFNIILSSMLRLSSSRFLSYCRTNFWLTNPFLCILHVPSTSTSLMILHSLSFILKTIWAGHDSFCAPAPHFGGQDSLPVQHMLCVWWTNWYSLGQVISEYCDFCRRYYFTNALRSYFIYVERTLRSFIQ